MEQTLVAEANDAPRAADFAFERLYRSSRDDVYAYVASLLRDGPAAEEVTAAAFERAYRKRNRFDPERGEPRAWLFGIARNAALDELRRRGRQAELTAEPSDVESVGAVEGTERSERRLAVSAALERLRRLEAGLLQRGPRLPRRTDAPARRIRCGQGGRKRDPAESAIIPSMAAVFRSFFIAHRLLTLARE